jgi:glycolate oxidase FAD binding subunit
LRVGIGRIASRDADVVLSLARLTLPIDHYAGDLVATVAAGAPLGDVNALLRRGGQWLPLDPPASERATIGGIVATNDSGPRRHRYGTPRDLIIGIEMVLADGRIAKAGGRVVKNVAGYDLARLMCGSFGSLAVITSATFKLSPVPPASRTVITIVSDVRSLGELARAIAAAPVTPSAIELSSPPHRLMVRFETTPSAADLQAALVCDLCAGRHATSTIVSDQREADAWRTYEEGIWQAPGTLLKVAVLPTDVSTLLECLDRSATAHGVAHRAGGRAALGVLYVQLTTNSDRHATVIAELRREAGSRGGSVVVVHADSGADPDRSSDVRWGEMGDALPLMRAVKARFDPKGTLNPGGGPGGL